MNRPRKLLRSFSLKAGSSKLKDLEQEVPLAQILESLSNPGTRRLIERRVCARIRRRLIEKALEEK